MINSLNELLEFLHSNTFGMLCTPNYFLPSCSPFKERSKRWRSPGTGAPWCGCRRPGRCRSRPPRPACCATRSCPGSARPWPASAARWPARCPRRSSGSGPEGNKLTHTALSPQRQTAQPINTAAPSEGWNFKLLQRQTAMKLGKCFQFESPEQPGWYNTLQVASLYR